jgi:hypothetical protein
MTYTDYATMLAAAGYRRGAPSLEVAEGDAPIAEAAKCQLCGAQMEYRAWHRDGTYIPWEEF